MTKGKSGTEQLVGQFTAGERALLLELRRALHRNPEPSWQELKTQSLLKAAIEQAGIKVVREVAKTGLIARIPGTAKGGPVVAIRGDIDGLPILEETELPYASETPGMMHACGHDMHATWTVAAGMLLAKSPAVGEVLLVLQPAEEVGEGAAKVLASGALEGVAAMFGAHVDWRYDVGEFVADAGPLAASTDTFEVDFRGSGGHGARPQDTKDPVVGMAAFVCDVQTVVSRRLDPAVPGVISVGILKAGGAPNVIPETSHCAGTIRATTPEVRKMLADELGRLAHSVAATHQLKAKVTLKEGTPPLINPERGAGWAQDAVRELLGKSALRSLLRANMGGEDFAFYLEKMDGCFLRVGTHRGAGERVGVHNSKFNPDEETIFLAGAVLAECARKASAELAG
ncbi:MAG: amidohydrolase [Gemmatimonadales bacterium]|nr:amidohydrolase [Gemmatimonadota bacterium]MCL4214969.1 amidohydrolase [Gemmatimonadales bacterium]